MGKPNQIQNPNPVAVAYLRVSTQKQGRSGLGLEAQREAVAQFTQSRGWAIVAEFVEVESGRRADRPELQKAIAETKRAGGRLVIAKLDRLARNVHFLTGLQDARVPFIACDMPEADEFTVQIIAAVAQREAKLASERTRSALAAAKARGVRLGSPANLTPEARAKGPKARQAQAVGDYRKVADLVSLLREHGASYVTIAHRLNEAGHKTTGGSGKPSSEFTPMTIWRMCQRAQA